jgi:hypothetical protein
MAQPTRIEPLRLADGKTITPIPPTAGSWAITADGALQPRDRDTAKRAGLDWVEPAATAPVAAPAPAAPAATTTKS